MTLADEPDPSPLASTPPTVPGTLPQPVRPPIWPTVVGVIAIVYSALGILGTLGATFVTFVLPALLRAMNAPADVTRNFESLEGWRSTVLSMSVAGLALSIMLMVAGLKLLRRQAAAVKWCLCWASLACVQTVGGAVQTYFMQLEQSSNQPHFAPPAFMPVVQTVFTLASGLVFPVFLLIWLSRPGIKEQTTGWT